MLCRIRLLRLVSGRPDDLVKLLFDAGWRRYPLALRQIHDALSLIDDGGEGEAYAWEKSPVPPAQQIRGLGPITLSVPDLKATDAVLTTLMGMREVRTYPHPENARDTVHVYEMGEGGAGAELHIAVQPELRPASQGAGGVHHVAFRTPDSEYDAWAERLNKLRVPNRSRRICFINGPSSGFRSRAWSDRSRL